ncbi:centromere protein P isoform X2 [Hyperolius riggenbachi]|uniref:centromere protein P isoform X2 n=1 Tax=Hyperolius riggenbachi TaxID=752182 RepID=UPI0035A35371
MSENMMERLESATSSLKQEILQLKEEYKENQREIAFLSSANVQNALMSFQENKGDESRKTLSWNLNTKLVQYETQVKFFQQITGIEVKHYFKRTEQKRENEVLYNHKMAGRCLDLPFELEFKTIESQSEQQGECKVSHISVQMDCQAHPSLMQLLQRTETTMDLLGFFRSLSDYAEWAEFRRNTFAQFKTNSRGREREREKTNSRERGREDQLQRERERRPTPESLLLCIQR